MHSCSLWSYIKQTGSILFQVAVKRFYASTSDTISAAGLNTVCFIASAAQSMQESAVFDT